jgi:hypothetical protein
MLYKEIMNNHPIETGHDGEQMAKRGPDKSVIHTGKTEVAQSSVLPANNNAAGRGRVFILKSRTAITRESLSGL